MKVFKFGYTDSALVLLGHGRKMSLTSGAHLAATGGGGHAGLGQERNGPASWAAGKKRKEIGEEGKSWAGPKTREREKSFEIKINQI